MLKRALEQVGDDGVLHEAIALMSLSHHRIVKILGVMLDKKQPSMMLEFIDSGNLQTYALQPARPMPSACPAASLPCMHASYLQRKASARLPVSQRTIFCYQASYLYLYRSQPFIQHVATCSRLQTHSST